MKKSCLRTAFFVLGKLIFHKQKSPEVSKFKAFERVYYTLARNNRELQLHRLIHETFSNYTLARNNRELQLSGPAAMKCPDYTLARNNRELQQSVLYCLSIWYYTLARNNRELQYLL